MDKALRHTAKTLCQMDQGLRHMDRRPCHMDEGHRLMAEAVRHMDESLRHMAKSLCHIAERVRHMAESLVLMAKAKIQTASIQRQSENETAFPAPLAAQQQRRRLWDNKESMKAGKTSDYANYIQSDNWYRGQSSALGRRQGDETHFKSEVLVRGSSSLLLRFWTVRITTRQTAMRFAPWSASIFSSVLLDFTYITYYTYYTYYE
jgi:hypothetical protein